MLQWPPGIPGFHTTSEEKIWSRSSYILLCVIVVLSFLNSALRDHRIELVLASSQELTIRINDVSLSDEGQYTCSLFTMPVKTTKAFLTVLGEMCVVSLRFFNLCHPFNPLLHSGKLSGIELHLKLQESQHGQKSQESPSLPPRMT